MGFVEGFTAGWNMIDTMEQRKRQAALDARRVKMEEEASARAAAAEGREVELFPTRKEGLIAGARANKLQGDVAQDAFDFAKATRPERERAAKLTNDAHEASIAASKLQRDVSQNTLAFAKRTEDRRFDAVGLANDAQAASIAASKQQAANSKQTYDHNANLYPEALTHQRQMNETGELALKEARELGEARKVLYGETPAAATTPAAAAPAAATIDDMIADPSKFQAVKPLVNDWLTKRNRSGKRLELSNVFKLGDNKYVVSADTYDPETGSLIAKNRPLTIGATGDGDAQVQFFTRDELNAKLQEAQAPKPTLAAAQVPVTSNAKPMSSKVDWKGFEAYSPVVMREADRVFAEKNLEAYGIDRETWQRTMIGLTAQESGFRPKAVSPKAANGLTQVMPDTARDPGYGVSPLKDNTPQENIRFGAEYLAAMLKETNGNLPHALAAYNGGPGAIKKHNGPIPGNPENQNYARLVQRFGQSDLYDHARAFSGERPVAPVTPGLAPAAQSPSVAPVSPNPTSAGVAAKPEAPVPQPSAISGNAASNEAGGLSWISNKVSTAFNQWSENGAAERDRDYQAGVFKRIALSGFQGAAVPVSDQIKTERREPSEEMGMKYWVGRDSFSGLDKSTLKNLDEHYAAFKPAKPTAPAASTLPIAATSQVAPAAATDQATATKASPGLGAAASSLTPEQMKAGRLVASLTKDPNELKRVQRLMGEGPTEIVKGSDGRSLIVDSDSKKVRGLLDVNEYFDQGRGKKGKGYVDKEELDRRQKAIDLLPKLYPKFYKSEYTDDRGVVHVGESPKEAARFQQVLGQSIDDYPDLDYHSMQGAAIVTKAYDVMKSIEAKVGEKIFSSLTPVLMMYTAGMTEADPDMLVQINTEARAMVEQSDNKMSLAEATNRAIAPRHPIAGKLLELNPKMDAAAAMLKAMQIDAMAEKLMANGEKAPKNEIVAYLVSQAPQSQ